MRSLNRARWCLVLLTAIVWDTQPARASKRVECPNPDDEESKIWLSVAKIKKQAKALPKKLERRRVHISDLSHEAQTRRRKINKDLASGDWCLVNSHLRVIEDGLLVTDITRGFVAEKFGRVERIVRMETTRRSQPKALDWVSKAATRLSKGDFRKANQHLNEALFSLFRLRRLWDPIPEADPASTKTRVDPKLSVKSEEVETACPTLAQKGRGDGQDLENVLNRLQTLMNKRRVRPQDIKGGEHLKEDLRSYVSLRATWPAIRTACATIARVKETDVDLGMVMGRFHRVNRMREERGIADSVAPKFRELVRSASEAISEREFGRAHDDLENLLVLLGEPHEPARALIP